jgi:hypothetical protein
MGLDNNLAVSMVFNTTKQMCTNFEKTVFWSSEIEKKNGWKLWNK